MQHPAAMQRLDGPADLPTDRQPLLRRQRAVLGDVVHQRLALEILQDKVRPGFLGVGPRAGEDADEGGVVEFLNPAALAEDGLGVAVEGVGAKRLDDHFGEASCVPARSGLPVVTEEGGAEAAGAEDAERLVAAERERLEGVGVEGGGAAEGGEGLVPVAPFEGGAVDVVMGLRLGNGVGDEAGDLLEIVLSGLDVADDDFELGEAVEQGRQLALVFGRQIAEALDEVLDDLALGVAAKGEAVARPDGAGVQVVAPLESGHGLVQLRVRLAGVVLFRLHV